MSWHCLTLAVYPIVTAQFIEQTALSPVPFPWWLVKNQLPQLVCLRLWLSTLGHWSIFLFCPDLDLISITEHKNSKPLHRDVNLLFRSFQDSPYFENLTIFYPWNLIPMGYYIQKLRTVTMLLKKYDWLKLNWMVALIKNNNLLHFPEN